MNPDVLSRRPVILTFVAGYLPGFKSGGPTRTVANMVARLGGEFDFLIVTSDRDLGDTRPYADVRSDSWTDVGRARVFYASPSRRSLWSLARLMRTTPHDIVYLNSFFSPRFTILPLIARRLRVAPLRPTVIAPRGEFSEGALGIKSLKKHLFIRASGMIGLYRELYWQASSPSELEDIVARAPAERGQVGVSPIIAPDLAARCCTHVPIPPRSGRKRGIEVVFLSRISRMKNLLYALQVMRRVTIPAVLTIYGSMEDVAYWNECQSLIRALPEHVTVEYRGGVPHESVAGTLEQYDLFLLPTLGENYGHVIREALEAGLPVLISNRTPWRELEAAGVGWDISLDDQTRFVAAVESLGTLSPSDRSQQRDRCKAYVARIGEDDDAVARNASLFWGALTGSTSCPRRSSNESE